MQVRTDWTHELHELREAVHELDGRLAKILVNLDMKCGVHHVDGEESLARELDELGEL